MEERCAAHRAIAMGTLADDDIEAIRLHLQRQHALGSDRFHAAIEAQLARPATPLKIGGRRKLNTDQKVEPDPCFSTGPGILKWRNKPLDSKCVTARLLVVGNPIVVHHFPRK